MRSMQLQESARGMGGGCARVRGAGGLQPSVARAQAPMGAEICVERVGLEMLSDGV